MVLFFSEYLPGLTTKGQGEEELKRMGRERDIATMVLKDHSVDAAPVLH